MSFSSRSLNQVSLLLALAITVLCLLFPRMDGDAAVYALLAKHMVIQGDVFNLVFQGKDWLDKPHFPFWMMALSFKLFGINEYAYQLPGLVFFFLGAWFTGKLAQYFHDASTAALARLMYLSLMGLLLAVHDQKAEVYLLALMTGASYAWLKYEQHASFKYGLPGSLCTAAALMTKGIFVLGLLGVGVVALLVYRRAWSRLFHWKWLLAGLATLFFTLPELLSLYLQFDAHPEKQVFGRTGVSGLKFFFWDSQFGRFLNTGPIQNTKGSPFFFVHNLIWTFFPLLLVLLAVFWTAIGQVVAGLRRQTRPAAPDAGQGGADASVFLLSTFLLAFALFSATSYQMDYYLVIVFPYAAVACAQVLQTLNLANSGVRWLLRAHWGLLVLVMLLTIAFSVLYFWYARYVWILLALVPLLLLLVSFRRLLPSWRVLVGSLATVYALFAFTVVFHRDLYVGYNIGHVMASHLNAQARQPVFIYNMIFNTFDFFSAHPTLPVRSASELLQATRQPCCGSSAPIRSFYLVARTQEVPALLEDLARQMGADADLKRPAADALVMPNWKVTTLQQFSEIELPKQFVLQLLMDDSKLPRQSLSIVKVELPS